MEGRAYASQKITVSAAISLKNAFNEIAKIYEGRHPGVKIFFNFGASGNLMMQIEEGAPVDVFASAAEKQMNEIAKKGLIAPGSRADFAENTVVLIAPAGQKYAYITSFMDLADPRIKRVAIGNPKSVPAGMYSEEALQYFKLTDAVSKKLIYGEHVRQVLEYVARGEVDAGLVYSTDARIEAGQVRVAAVAPPSSHKPVVYPIAVIKGSPNGKLARSFEALVVSPEGENILRKYGFEPK
ncbi:MAG: molybdate ABC transporter substrate-binding protein [Nitrospiraceae bacterium]|nr:molybdate ABC transporter substrate-binding protein [Nitrospiraceae bacterium]MDA8090901.1 molybdate ABC transporter substrate-binding protein [Nitrospiraceae bacterium]